MTDVDRQPASERWVLGDLTVRHHGGPDPAGRVDADIGRLDSLRSVAEFDVPIVTGDFGEWLITRRPPGRPGDRPDLHPDPDDLVVAVATGLRALHDIPLQELTAPNPDTWSNGGWTAVVARCRAAVENDLVDVVSLPEPYCRYPATELLAMLIEGRPDRGHDDADVVCCHGSATAGRFLVDDGRFIGFDGFESTQIADRHFDLAVIHRSVQEVFGPEAVFRLYEAYGKDPDIARLEHYVLAGHLLPDIWSTPS